MSGTIEKYAGMLGIDLKMDFAYRGNAALNVVFNIAYPLVMLFVWTTIYHASNVSSIGNFTLTSMILYFFMISMVGYTADPKTAFAMEEDIASGTITPYLTRPISYIAGLVMSTISQNIFFMLLPGMVIIVPLIFLFHVSVTLQLVSVLAAELVACYLISLLIGILMGTCAVYLTRISGMINSEQFLATILGGSIVPISLFPAKISSILSLLPFQFLYYVPAATFSGELPIGAAIGSLWLAAVWIVILSIAAYAFWTRARKRITAVGV